MTDNDGTSGQSAPAAGRDGEPDAGDEVTERGSHLSQRVRGAFKWSLAQQVAARVGALLTNIVLARILVPEDFGAYAVALSAIQILISMNDLGITTAMIRWQGDFRQVSPTGATLAAVSSGLMYVLTFVAAPTYASMMGAPEATGVVRTLALAILVDGLVAAPTAGLIRDFRQDRLATAQGASVPVLVAVSVLLAVNGAGAWSLAIGRLSATAVTASLVLVLSPHRPLPGLDRDRARELLHFGVPFAGSLLTQELLLNADYLIVGALLDTTSLGIYLLAFNLSGFPHRIITATVRPVAVAGFSRLTHDRERLVQGMSRWFGLLMVLAVPLAVFLGLLAEPVVLVVYGARWLEAANVLAFLAVLGGVRVVVSFVVDALAAEGRSRTTLALYVGWLLVSIPALVAGTRVGGVEGTAFAHAAVALVVVLPASLVLFAHLGPRIRQLGLEALPAVVSGAAAAAAILGVNVAVSAPLPRVLLGGVAGTLTFTAVLMGGFGRSLSLRSPAVVTGSPDKRRRQNTSAETVHPDDA